MIFVDESMSCARGRGDRNRCPAVPHVQKNKEVAAGSKLHVVSRQLRNAAAVATDAALGLFEFEDQVRGTNAPALDARATAGQRPSNTATPNGSRSSSGHRRRRVENTGTSRMG